MRGGEERKLPWETVAWRELLVAWVRLVAAGWGEVDLHGCGGSVDGFEKCLGPRVDGIYRQAWWHHGKEPSRKTGGSGLAPLSESKCRLPHGALGRGRCPGRTREFPSGPAPGGRLPDTPEGMRGRDLGSEDDATSQMALSTLQMEWWEPHCARPRHLVSPRRLRGAVG